MNRNLVYGTQADANPAHSDIGTTLAAYDYRAFGEMIELTPSPTGKVTENFTGKEHDDEIALDYFGARYLDPMLGMWISVDPARQFASPYLYVGNGMNPINVVDPDGNEDWLLLDANNIIQKKKHVDNENNMVHIIFASGNVKDFAAPSAYSYFYSENIVGEKFDTNMKFNIRKMINEVYSSTTPIIDYLKWRSGGKFDFKSRYYENKVNTVGVLKGTVMTARDVGNALWGERMKDRNWSWYAADFISDVVAEWRWLMIFFGFGEDIESKDMQDWGYHGGN